MKYDPDPLGSRAGADAFVRPGAQRVWLESKRPLDVDTFLYTKQDFV